MRRRRRPIRPGDWFPFFQFGATNGAFLLFLVYLLIALTGFKGQPGENRAGLALAGLLAGATAVAALYGVWKDAPSIYWFDKIWWLAPDLGADRRRRRRVAKSRGNLQSHTSRRSRTDRRRGQARNRGVPDPARSARRSASRRPRCACAQATRSSIGTHSSVVCAQVDVARARSRSAGMPASTVSVAPSCQLSRPPRLWRCPRRAPAPSAACTTGSSAGTSAGGTPPTHPDRSRAGARASHGSAAAASRDPVAELLLHARAVAALVGLVGQVLDVAVERAARPGRRRATRRPRRSSARSRPARGTDARGRSAHSSRRRRTASSTMRHLLDRVDGAAQRRAGSGAMPAWPARPSTVMRGRRLPRQATQTSRPLGSGTIARVGLRACAHATSPPAPVDSSSVTVLTIRSPAQPHAERGQHARRRAPCRPRRPSCRTRRGRAPRRRATHGRERVGLRPVGARLDRRRRRRGR